MDDREKVIKGLECCFEYETHLSIAGGLVCEECPYNNNNYLGTCTALLFRDALELLKEQEPVEAKVMGESKSHGSWWFACGACGHAIDPEDNFCRECGRKVKLDERP